MRDMRDKDKKVGAGHKGRPTLRTIAELTGLSLSTVSLSLRGGESLKEETRRKVAEAAKSLGYVPDRAGVRLRTGKTNVIALVLDGGPDSIDFAQNMIQGIGHAIKGTRYHLTVTPEFERTASVDSIRYILENRTADGVIITHTAPRDKRVQMLMDADFPFVTHGRTEFFTPHAYHDFDSGAFAKLAVERLVARGRRKLLLTIGDDRTTNYHTIVTSFQGAVTSAAISGTLLDNVIAHGRSAELRQFGIDLAMSPDRPDGIICDSETRAIALISGLHEGGLRIGRDVDLISKQTSDILPTVFPDVDSIEEDVYFAGIELTRLLLRRIEGESPDVLQTLSAPIPHWH